MRSGTCTASDRSVLWPFPPPCPSWGFVPRVVVWLLWMVVGSVASGQVPDAAPPDQQKAETAIELVWDWPTPVEHEQWLPAASDAVRWWLGIDLPQPSGAIPQHGRLALEIDPATTAWVWSGAAHANAALSHPRAASHRARLPRTTQEHLVLAEVMVDLNAVRRADPERAGFGSVARWLEFWKLSNAREMMFHVRAVPRPAPLPMVLEIDVTWSVRSDPPSVIRALRLSQPLGPVESATLTPVGAAWTVAMPMDVRMVIARAVGAAMASRDDALGGTENEFDRSILRWARAARDRVTRLRAVLGDRVLLSGNGSWVMAKVPLARARGGRSVVADLTAMQARLKDGASHTELAGRVSLSDAHKLRWEVSQDETSSWLWLTLGNLQDPDGADSALPE